MLRNARLSVHQAIAEAHEMICAANGDRHDDKPT